MKTANIYLTPEQLTAAADWSTAGETMAEVELQTENKNLRARQGDAWALFDPIGTCLRCTAVQRTHERRDY